jgi:hypothetical protein
MTEIICDNIKHKKILEKYLRNIKAVVYFATEDEEVGKFHDFNSVLDMIITYSNEFYNDNLNWAVGAEEELETISEWRYMIPNLVVFSTVSFLAGITTESNRKNMEKIRAKLFRKTSEIIGETYDIYADNKLEKEFKVKLKEI